MLRIRVATMNSGKTFRPCSFVTDKDVCGQNVLSLFFVATYVNAQYQSSSYHGVRFEGADIC